MGGLGRLPLGADALQQHRGGFVVGVLGHQLSGKRLLEDALTQPLRPLQVGRHRGFGLLDNRQAAFHLGDNAVLFGQGGQRQRDFLYPRLVECWLIVSRANQPRRAVLAPEVIEDVLWYKSYFGDSNRCRVLAVASWHIQYRYLSSRLALSDHTQQDRTRGMQVHAAILHAFFRYAFARFIDSVKSDLPTADPPNDTVPEVGSFPAGSCSDINIETPADGGSCPPFGKIGEFEYADGISLLVLPFALGLRLPTGAALGQDALQ